MKNHYLHSMQMNMQFIKIQENFLTVKFNLQARKKTQNKKNGKQHRKTGGGKP